MGFENKFDEAIEEVSVANGVNWNEDSKIRIFARFLGTHRELFQEWENFLERQADEELVSEEEEAETDEFELIREAWARDAFWGARPRLDNLIRSSGLIGENGATLAEYLEISTKVPEETWAIYNPDTDNEDVSHEPIPEDWPVQPLKLGEVVQSKATCGHCGLSWDDAKVTSLTPAPSARCPFESFHVYPR